MQQPALMYFPTICAEPQQERAMKAERGVTFGGEGVQRSRNEEKKGSFPAHEWASLQSHTATTSDSRGTSAAGNSIHSGSEQTGAKVPEIRMKMRV